MICEDTLKDSNEKASSDCTHYSHINPFKVAQLRLCKNSLNRATLKGLSIRS